MSEARPKNARDKTSSTDAEPLSKAHLRLWLNLLKVSMNVEATLRRRFKEQFDTTLPRFDVLAALSRSEAGMKMSEISSFLKVSNGNITGIVDRLVEDGLAIRLTVPGDRRASLVRLTEAGRETFQTYAKAHEGWIAEMFRGLDAARAEELSELLKEAGAPWRGALVGENGDHNAD